jgi:hypothetical protein
MQISQKLNDQNQAARTPASTDNQKDAGLTLTTKQSWLLVTGILIFFGTLLFFGYKDWQRQRQMSREFEQHLRNMPISQADEEKGARNFLVRDTDVD